MIEWNVSRRVDDYGMPSYRATVAGIFDIRVGPDFMGDKYVVRINDRTLKGRPTDLDAAKQLAATALVNMCRKALRELGQP